MKDINSMYSINGTVLTDEQLQEWQKTRKTTITPHTLDQDGYSILPINAYRKPYTHLLEELSNIGNDFENQFGELDGIVDQLLVTIDGDGIKFEHLHVESPEEFLNRYKVTDEHILKYGVVNELCPKPLESEMLVVFENNYQLLFICVPSEAFNIFELCKDMLDKQKFYSQYLKSLEYKRIV